MRALIAIAFLLVASASAQACNFAASFGTRSYAPQQQLFNQSYGFQQSYGQQQFAAPSYGFQQSFAAPAYGMGFNQQVFAQRVFAPSYGYGVTNASFLPVRTVVVRSGFSPVYNRGIGFNRGFGLGGFNRGFFGRGFGFGFGRF